MNQRKSIQLTHEEAPVSNQNQNHNVRLTNSGDSAYMYSASITCSSGDPLLSAPNSVDHLRIKVNKNLGCIWT
ncbi:hypothetical protein Tsubulata_026853 [Turnera subulata]|uniref:Uncharacterized protein n=1 Tax=Turnera subulata TaxID=218843 RepID=A0A9Q0GBT4_9ROSI|nr:hypothetical protein Tsubulata_026853 [Turnera subulata]